MRFFRCANASLYLAVSVGWSVGWSVTHSFDDPLGAPYWPTWPCFLHISPSTPYTHPRSKKYFFVRPVFDHSHFGNASNEPGLFGDSADNNQSSPVTSSSLTGQAQFPATSVGLRSLLCQGCNLGTTVKHIYKNDIKITTAI